ncbi:hypothetical protein EB810_02805 [Altererythrobacter sp. FM1]|uniref:BLUF domain-containing protein n=1 Tax=Tsuneonella flava TaxID=2055955 RepID=A0ABX7KBD1_9SPHN|nr:hypothetical protein [Tsuneonella flava]QSB45178.1 hypothetical protein IDJ81_03275 [Tsuneonella flava]ROT96883.1 hypothetical protein EB810_02805 [Altererythrobacter sp. FM1]
MLVDDAKFPIVHMYYNRTDERGDDASFQIFEDLLQREQTFILIGVGEDADHDQSVEERKRVTLWMKRNRQALHSYVRAMVYIEPSKAKRLLAKTSAPIFQKFWGFPMLFTASEAEAESVAAQLLAGEHAGQIEEDQAS